MENWKKSCNPHSTVKEETQFIDFRWRNFTHCAKSHKSVIFAQKVLEIGNQRENFLLEQDFTDFQKGVANELTQLKA
jgi:hypothetical protein